MIHDAVLTEEAPACRQERETLPQSNALIKYELQHPLFAPGAFI